MARVHFTSQLERFTEAPVVTAPGETVAEVMAIVFVRHPVLKSYVVDDQGAVRRHVQIFVDGGQIKDRAKLTDPVNEATEIYVFQALSGGTGRPSGS
jgi:molybdopterin synthase sulfur carrier subunit